MTEQGFSERLLIRLGIAADKQTQIERKNKIAKEKLSRALPILAKALQGNQLTLAAMREIYATMEEEGEELSSAIIELKETKDVVEMMANMLQEAGYDLANIRQITDEKIWFASHLPTIRRAVAIFEIPLLEQALVEADKERFEAIEAVLARARQKR